MENTSHNDFRANQNPLIPVMTYFIRTSDGRCFQNETPVQPTSLNATITRLLKNLHRDGYISDDELVRQVIILRETLTAYKARFNEMLKQAKAIRCTSHNYSYIKAWREKRKQKLADEKKGP